MPDKFIEPKTYMIVARRSTSDVSFCEIGGAKSSLRYWAKLAYLIKTNHSYLIYKFNKEVAAYELKFDGQSAADLFVDGLSPKEVEDTMNAVFTTL